MGQKSSKLKNVLEQLKEETDMSIADLKEWHKTFLEEHPSGLITVEEFVDMTQSAAPPGCNSEAFAKILFNAYDMDKNGTIDFQEFVLTMNIASKGSPAEKLSWAFDLYDLDDDGFISRAEALSIYQALYEMNGVEDSISRAEESTGELFESLDRDDDGLLSRNEFLNGARRSSILQLP